MNILHFVDSTDLRGGGVPRFVLDAARVMADEGHPSTILTTDTLDTPTEWLETAQPGNRLPRVVKLERSKLPGGFLSQSAMRAVRERIRNADVVHMHCVWSPPNLQIAAACRASGVPYVVSCHGMLDDWCMAQSALKKRTYLALGGRRLLEGAARVHCTAEGEVEQSRKWFPRGRVFLMPYIMDLDLYRDLPGKDAARVKHACLRDDSEPTVLFLSRLHYKKGIEHLLRAAAELKARGVKAKFALAGTGDAAYIDGLKAMARDLGVADKVHFLGMVKGEEKVSVYQNADLFVLPTSQENFGIVLIEALASKTPLITTKGVDIWRDVQRSGAAGIVDQDSMKIADMIAAMLADPDRKAKGEAARDWVFRTYDESVIVPKFAAMYQEVAAEAAVGSGRLAMAH